MSFERAIASFLSTQISTVEERRSYHYGIGPDVNQYLCGAIIAIRVWVRLLFRIQDQAELWKRIHELLYRTQLRHVCWRQFHAEGSDRGQCAQHTFNGVL